MKTKFAGMVAVLVLIGFVLGGCGCFMQAQKGETPPPPPPAAVVQPPPPPPPAPKRDRN